MILKLSLAAKEFWYASSYLYSKFGSSTKTLLFKVVFHSSILLSASPVDGHLPAVVAWGL
jgi:hypothetical protein